jgi:hypothetical protein
MSTPIPDETKELNYALASREYLERERAYASHIMLQVCLGAAIVGLLLILIILVWSNP